ncbi:MAG: signal peptidase I [bacterium]
MLRRLGAFFLDILEVLVFAIGIFFFVYLLIMRPHKIKGPSMYPTYLDGEFLLTEKVSYYMHEPKRGDVVVFKPPVSEDEYIKRIIALPNETVSINNGKFYINGSLLKEAYITPDVYTSDGTYLEEGVQKTIPEGQYLTVGDNRSHSYDSRSWGPISKKDVTGRAWIVYWPPNKVGTVNAVDY